MLAAMKQTSQTGMLDTGDGAIYFEVGGAAAGIPLVLNHAAFLDSGMWDSQWAPLGQHFQLIRYDMRGYGRSAPIDGPRAFRYDLLKLLQHLGVDRAHLLGCSMGGEYVLDLALEHPKLAASLILINSTPSGFEMQGPPPPEVLELIATTQNDDIERQIELQLQIWVDGPHRISAGRAVDPAVRAHAARMNRTFVENRTWGKMMMGAPIAPLAPPAIARLEDVRAPTLVMTGALDADEVLRAAKLMKAGIHGARQVEMANAAHVPNMEHPTEFNHQVLEFLGGL
jgi:pimeloyl-ACP methyl ester carboxylesterase